jgi:hypothetical protein
MLREFNLGDRVQLLTHTECFDSDLATIVEANCDYDCMHIDGYDYGSETWDCFRRNGYHTNFHRAYTPEEGKGLQVRLVGKPGAFRYGLSKFMREKGVL